MIARDKSVLLMGSRQTGKTTLIKELNADLYLNFMRPDNRQLYETNPSRLVGEVELLAKESAKKPLIILDEVQLIPELLNASQDLIDRQIACFIFTGSSMRKLRSSHINLLPGRVVTLELMPMIQEEFTELNLPLEDLLIYGTLPGIWKGGSILEKEEDLKSYVLTYLEEEVRQEAKIRNMGQFNRFLELAASESGQLVSFRKLASDVQSSHSAISSYYQVLEDCLIAHRVEPYIKTKTRRRLTKSAKYLLFDMGVRRVAAKEPAALTANSAGRWFEHYVGLELINQAAYHLDPVKVHFWRDLNGQEVDWVLSHFERLIPIEVKWTETPTLSDAKHLKLFLDEYPEADKAYVICRTPRAFELADNIIALPWKSLSHVFD